MALSIKNEETEQLARKLARHNGETLTAAVAIAVKERLERQEQPLVRTGRIDRIRRIVERTAPLMEDGRSSKELFDELYDDETGLPT